MTETGNPPATEELAALREQLAEAHTHLERLQRESAAAEARATTAADEAADLRQQLAAAHEARESAAAEAQSARESLAAAEARLRTAAGRYRDLVVRTQPELPADLIAGDDVDAVEASVEAARAVVGRVRSHLEAQAIAARIPAGAPPRAAPDLSALSPEQKIRHGLGART